MKNSIDIQRLSRLFGIAWQQDVRRMALGLLICMGIGFTIFMFTTFDKDYSQYNYDQLLSVEAVFFTVSLFILACVSGVAISKCFRDKASSISALMLPASQAEKFFVRWLIFVPGFFIAFLIGAFAADVLRSACAMALYGPGPNISLLVNQPDFGHDLWTVLKGALTLQSFFVLGGTIWPKRGLLYTSLVLFIYGWILGFSVMFVLHNHYDVTQHISLTLPFSPSEQLWIDYLISILALAVNYTLAYFRTKEMEIIPRW